MKKVHMINNVMCILRDVLYVMLPSYRTQLHPLPPPPPSKKEKATKHLLPCARKA